jgi:hypothetical protein
MSKSKKVLISVETLNSWVTLLEAMEWEVNRNLFLKEKIEKIIANADNMPTHDFNHGYFLSDDEYKKMEKLKSNTVKMTGSAIGIKTECLVDDKWVDITNYESW